MKLATLSTITFQMFDICSKFQNQITSTHGQVDVLFYIEIYNEIQTFCDNTAI